jgi:hypothetical protein
MRKNILACMLAGVLGVGVLGLSGCYASSASVGVGVEAHSPGVAYYGGYAHRDGYTWIDGHWAWTASGWQWAPGYWVEARPGYVYVQGYWDYWGGRWMWRPGLWASSRNGYVWLGGRWHRHHRGYHHYDHRQGRWVHGGRGYRGPHTYRGPRTYRTPSGRIRSDHRGERPRPMRQGRPGGRPHRR